ncbi:low temperature requirement protein A [Micromonospora krabiensis]|uniref:Low temperature requirement protein LtrA n=1 Tax=Micromonospora krabiensis TaxID=307121 RepID=A0A1C3N2T0_9ACTN|nr:low temperature requirement protein A [Micromonospora krabiensis]SBV26884.1 Low temperature requirement protein LtrA [Micromonospora krabiensis]
MTGRPERRAADASGQPTVRRGRGLRPVTGQTRVTVEEIFFDVVFVFAFIQVTTLMTAEAGALGVLHGLLVLTLMWWSWSLFAWLGNRVRCDFGLSRLVLLAATPVMFTLAVSTREAFADLPGGVYTPLVFVASFVVLRLLYLALRLYATPSLGGRERVALIGPMLVATLLLLLAAALPRSGLGERTVEVGQVLLWTVAVGVDYGVGLAVKLSQRAVFSVRHWTERHGLIVIVALGEVLVAVGIAGSDVPTTAGLLLASVLAVVVAGALGWIYFDLSALVGEYALRDADPARRVTLARDAYSYLHLPLIVGVILLAVGLKHTPSLVVASQSYREGDPLDQVGRYAMYGGVALYLVAHAAFQLRLSRLVVAVVWPRLLAATALLAMLPLTGRIAALRSLVWLAVICVVTAMVEFMVSRRQRRGLRQALAEEIEGGRPDGPGPLGAPH